MDMLTRESTFADIYQLPEFKGIADYVCPGGMPGSPMAGQKLSDYEPYGWSPEGMIEGFTQVAEKVKEGYQVIYPFYTEDEVAKKPELAQGYLTHFPVNEKTGFVVLCCGGAYIGAASMIEGYPSCKEINDMGYHVFTVNYRASEFAKAPNPIDDLAKALQFIFSHAEALNVDPAHYAVGGFSAGGHLAACFGTEALGWKKYGLPRPETMILAYPVITMGEYTHEDSRKNFLQENADNEEMRERYSVEKQVTSVYPPSFIWQCDKDYAVPIQNTQMLVAALEQAGVDKEYVTYDSTMHGWGSAKGTMAEGWIRQAVAFWEKHQK